MTTGRNRAFPVLGARITSRTKGGTDKWIFGALILMWIPVGLGLSLTGPLPGWANLLVGAPLVLAVGAFAAYRLFRVVAFYEHAAVERAFSHHRVFRYDEAKEVDLTIVERYVEFIYSGTVFRMRLQMADGRTLRIQEPYEGEDDKIHVVYRQIQEKIAERIWQPAAVAEARPSKKHYYVWAAYQEKGPYTLQELRAALRDKKLTASTPVRAEDEIDTRALEELLRQHPGKK